MLEVSTATTTASLAIPRRRNAVWGRLRRNPEFWMGAVLVGFFLVITVWPSLVAGAFGHGDPRACDLADSRGVPDVSSGTHSVSRSRVATSTPVSSMARRTRSSSASLSQLSPC